MLAFAPGCQGADACALGVGGRSMQVSSRQEIPYDQIVAALSIESGGG